MSRGKYKTERELITDIKKTFKNECDRFTCSSCPYNTDSKVSCLEVYLKKLANIIDEEGDDSYE